MTDPTAHPPLYPPGRVLALTGVVGLIGLVTHAAAVGRGWTFPSLGYAAGIVVWKLATLGVLAATLWRVERQPLSATALGLGPGLSPDERRRRRRRALLGLGGAVGLLGALSLAPDWGPRPLIRRHTGIPVRSVGLFCWSRCWSCIRSPSWPRRLSSRGSCSCRFYYFIAFQSWSSPTGLARRVASSCRFCYPFLRKCCVVGPNHAGPWVRANGVAAWNSLPGGETAHWAVSPPGSDACGDPAGGGTANGRSTSYGSRKQEVAGHLGRLSR